MVLYRSPLTVTLWPSSFLKKDPPARKAHQTIKLAAPAALNLYLELRRAMRLPAGMLCGGLASGINGVDWQSKTSTS
ncbi:hypothetical protein TNCV_1227521 [Trichonephila clavipes]|nr:hypothetical protein TNCV_1227521 [Trichonephila clavipes]